MRKILFPITLAVIALFSLPMFFNSRLNALEIGNVDVENDYTVLEDVEDNLVVYPGDNILVQGNVNGDLIVSGGSVIVKGAVKDNIIMAGGELISEGKIGRSVYAAGGQLNIKGNIGRNVLIAGGDIQITSDIKEDVYIAGGRINLSGNVGEDVVIAGGRIGLDSDVKGDVIIAGGMVRLSGDVGNDVLAFVGSIDILAEKIGGDVIVYSDEDGNVTKSQATKIDGKYEFRKNIYSKKGEVDLNPVDIERIFKGLWIASLWLRLGWAFLQSIGWLILGYVLLKFMPVRINGTIKRMNGVDNFLKSFIVGFAAFPVAAFLAFILGITLIGIPLLQALSGLAFFVIAIVFPVAALWLGRGVMKSTGSKRRYLIPLAVGIIFIQIFRLVPYISVIIDILLTMFVVGALLRYQYHKYKRARLHFKVK